MRWALFLSLACSHRLPIHYPSLRSAACKQATQPRPQWCCFSICTQTASKCIYGRWIYRSPRVMVHTYPNKCSKYLRRRDSIFFLSSPFNTQSDKVSAAAFSLYNFCNKLLSFLECKCKRSTLKVQPEGRNPFRIKCIVAYTWLSLFLCLRISFPHCAGQRKRVAAGRDVKRNIHAWNGLNLSSVKHALRNTLAHTKTCTCIMRSFVYTL